MAALTAGVPSLLGCERLEIRGPVQFEPGVIFKGKVTIENASAERQVVAAGTYADQTLTFS